LASKAWPLVSEASTSEGIKKAGVLSCRLCGGSPFAKVVHKEQLLGSMEKKTSQVCFLGDGVARKKKVEHFCSWKKLLEWLWAVLDWVSASRFKWAGLGLKPKRGKRG
jgi:hypothetical protein